MESNRAEPERRLSTGRDVRWTRERARFLAALALSIAIHALILSMEFGIPGFALPWIGQRAQEMVLTVTLTARVPEPPAEAPLPLAPVAGPSDGTATRGAPGPLAPSRADPSSFAMVAPTEVPVVPPQKPAARPRRAASAPRPTAEALLTEPQISPAPQPIVIAQDDPRQETFRVAPPEAELSRAPDVEAEEARRKAEAEEASRKAEVGRRKEEEAKRLALEAEATRRAEEAARQQLAARQKELEARKQAEIEEARRKSEVGRRKEEEAKQLALEAEEARRLALEAEAARQQAAARQKELEARRQAEEAAARVRAQELAERQQAEARQKAEVERRKEEDAKRLAAEQAAARAAAGASPPAGASPAPGALSGREIAARAIEQLRTPGVIPLDPPRPPPPPPPADGRRFPAFGAERDVVLRYYIESWRAKIERNGPLNYRPLASRRAPEYPVVTVAVRSDGSLEHVHINKSSGLREIDEAVRRIVEFNAPYSRFPPAIASQYDVIEIRRVWQFDDLLRIVEETR